MVFRNEEDRAEYNYDSVPIWSKLRCCSLARRRPAGHSAKVPSLASSINHRPTRNEPELEGEPRGSAMSRPRPAPCPSALAYLLSLAYIACLLIERREFQPAHLHKESPSKITTTTTITTIGSLLGKLGLARTSNSYWVPLVRLVRLLWLTGRWH